MPASGFGRQLHPDVNCHELPTARAFWPSCQVLRVLPDLGLRSPVLQVNGTGCGGGYGRRLGVVHGGEGGDGAVVAAVGRRRAADVVAARRRPRRRFGGRRSLRCGNGVSCRCRQFGSPFSAFDDVGRREAQSAASRPRSVCDELRPFHEPAVARGFAVETIRRVDVRGRSPWRGEMLALLLPTGARFMLASQQPMAGLSPKRLNAIARLALSFRTIF